MDWCLDTSEPESLRDIRAELTDYLRRHGKDGADLASARTAASEVVANAVEHGGGRYVWVSVDWGDERPVLSVHDLGEGFEPSVSLPDDPLSESGRGLYLATHCSELLEVAAKRAGGSTVRVTLPVPRRRELSHDPPRRRADSLPGPDEADEDGTFGKQSFLRALVVELSQSVDLGQGPDAAEAAVAQVGTNVGGRMEEAYRRARDLVGRLDADQMADLYVRLKKAIDGDFYVIEADSERIVLGNRACPFGEVVKRSPALCRMTSSVFGGIAARNTGAALVQLEERIAVGDPECRVVVWLGDAARRAERHGHRYEGHPEDRAEPR